MTEFEPPDFTDEDDVVLDEAQDSQTRRDRDGVASLRDIEAEAGDEDEVTDSYDMDDREARQLGVDLDGRDEPEPGLE